MFNNDLSGRFVTFGPSHLIALAVIFILSGAVIVFKETLRKNRLFDVFRYGLASMIIGQEILLNVYRATAETWTFADGLPFHLCGLAVLLSAYVLITENRKLFMNTFFIMMIGAILALLTPAINKNYGFPHFRFIQFFVSHGLITINITFILFVMDYQKEMRYVHVYKNALSLLVIVIFGFVVNLITGGNYLYIMEKPGANTAFDLFGEHPWYLVNIALFGVPVIFHLFYLPFWVRNIRFGIPGSPVGNRSEERVEEGAA
jgi:hypothetical integral membrane protein (TIGR02206 family)